MISWLYLQPPTQARATSWLARPHNNAAQMAVSEAILAAGTADSEASGPSLLDDACPGATVPLCEGYPV